MSEEVPWTTTRSLLLPRPRYRRIEKWHSDILVKISSKLYPQHRNLSLYFSMNILQQWIKIFVTPTNRRKASNWWSKILIKGKSNKWIHLQYKILPRGSALEIWNSPTVVLYPEKQWKKIFPQKILIHSVKSYNYQTLPKDIKVKKKKKKISSSLTQLNNSEEAYPSQRPTN